MGAPARKFEDQPAKRERTPLLVGLMGPSGSGKTYSALRLGTGIQKVVGGDIFVIDTEAGRAKHYAEDFKFRWVEFRPPFSPLDYLSAIEHCHKKGASVIIVDSMSHEHEGPGGLLDMHDQEHQRLGGSEGTKMLAWAKPKQDRRRLINSILQMQTNFVFCFRAKEKIKMLPVAGRDGRARNEPVAQGLMPIAGEEFVYEMTVNMLLYPGAMGVPTWKTEWVGERMMTKLPAQFRSLLARPVSLSEDIGRSLAEWATGTKTSEFELLARQIADSATLEQLEALVPEIQRGKDEKKLPPSEFKMLRAAYAERRNTLVEFAREQEAEAAEAAGEFDAPSNEGEKSDPLESAREPGVD